MGKFLIWSKRYTLISILQKKYMRDCVCEKREKKLITPQYDNAFDNV